MTIFFNSWDSIVQVLISAIFAYAVLIILLRLSGKRSLSKLNIFDFIITVALGSILASIIISKSTTIIDGIVAVSVLLLAQYAITWTSLRWSIVESIINPQPTLVFKDGTFLSDQMKKARVTEDELFASIRQNGIVCLGDVSAIVVESNGMISVLLDKDDIKQSTLQNLMT